MHRVAVVVHPTREIARPFATLERWASERGIELVQLKTPGSERVVAPFGEVDGCDLVTAVGGDGTVLAALRAAGRTGTPVLGVACGSLGALTAVRAPDLEQALASFAAGNWTSRAMQAIEATVDGNVVATGLNDFVLVRKGVGQLIVNVTVDGELYSRMAGDGVIVATPLGSSAYSMAAGGPVLVEGTAAYVVTPLVIHGGCAPPLVVRAGSEVTLDAHPGFGGFDVEVDGQTVPVEGTSFTLRLTEAKATLVAIAAPGLGLTALRHRGLIADSPRVLARDKREQG